MRFRFTAEWAREEAHKKCLSKEIDNQIKLVEKHILEAIENGGEMCKLDHTIDLKKETVAEFEDRGFEVVYELPQDQRDNTFGYTIWW